MVEQWSTMRKITIIFLVLTGVLVVAICIAVPLGTANSEAGGAREGCNSTGAVNVTCEDAEPQPEVLSFMGIEIGIGF